MDLRTAHDDHAQRGAWAHQSGQARALAVALALLGATFLVVIHQLHPVVGLGNHDVGGITYNAELLLAGKLPYVDSVEVKNPGSFFLVALAFRCFGHSAAVINGASDAWMLLGGLGVWVAARELYRDAGQHALLCAGGATFLFIYGATQFFPNYSTWMTTGYIWCLALALRALWRPGVALHLVVGALATCAFVLKTHAVVLGVAVPILWMWARWRGAPGATWHAWWAWIVGALLGALPLLAFYAAHDATAALLAGLFPFAYVSGYADSSSRTIFDAVPTIYRQLRRKFGLQTYLALAAVLAVASRQVRARILAPESRPSSTTTAPPPKLPVLPQIVIFVFGVIAGGFGGLRYFGHYSIQYLPGLALLAVHPALWRWLFLLKRPRRSWRYVFTLAPALALTLHGVYLTTYYVKRALHDKFPGPHRMHDSIRAGAFIQARTTDDDRIFCWGWRALSVYFFSQRLAPTPLYKPLPVYEIFPRLYVDGERRLGFVPHAMTDELLATMQAEPPPFLVYPDVVSARWKGDPFTEWEAFRAFVYAEYRLIIVDDHTRVLEHREHLEARKNAGDEAAIDARLPSDFEPRS